MESSSANQRSPWCLAGGRLAGRESRAFARRCRPGSRAPAAIQARTPSDSPRLLKMAALATSASVQISSAKLGCNARALGRKATVAPKQVARNTVAAAVSGEVPDMGKRNVMNLLLVGAIGLPATSLVGGFAYFFVPPG